MALSEEEKNFALIMKKNGFTKDQILMQIDQHRKDANMSRAREEKNTPALRRQNERKQFRSEARELMERKQADIARNKPILEGRIPGLKQLGQAADVAEMVLPTHRLRRNVAGAVVGEEGAGGRALADAAIVGGTIATFPMGMAKGALARGVIGAVEGGVFGGLESKASGGTFGEGVIPGAVLGTGAATVLPPFFGGVGRAGRYVQGKAGRLIEVAGEKFGSESIQELGQRVQFPTLTARQEAATIRDVQRMQQQARELQLDLGIAVGKADIKNILDPQQMSRGTKAVNDNIEFIKKSLPDSPKHQLAPAMGNLKTLIDKKNADLEKLIASRKGTRVKVKNVEQRLINKIDALIVKGSTHKELVEGLEMVKIDLLSDLRARSKPDGTITIAQLNELRSNQSQALKRFFASNKDNMQPGDVVNQQSRAAYFEVVRDAIAEIIPKYKGAANELAGLIDVDDFWTKKLTKQKKARGTAELLAKMGQQGMNMAAAPILATAIATSMTGSTGVAGVVGGFAIVKGIQMFAENIAAKNGSMKGKLELMEEINRTMKSIPEELYQKALRNAIEETMGITELSVFRTTFIRELLKYTDKPVEAVEKTLDVDLDIFN